MLAVVRRRAVSPAVATTDIASLERFQRELIEAGFKAIDPPDRRNWQGPIAASLSALTDATTMRIEFMDGWPYRQPRLFVDGISSEHVNNAGEVCLWPVGARDRAWLTLQGLNYRIDEWVAAAGAGFPDDTIFDAHLYFDPYIHPGIATVKLRDIVPRRRGAKGRVYGRWLYNGRLLELTTRRGDHPLTGRWYFVDRVSAPPRNFAEVCALLTSSQADSLDAGQAAVASGKGDRLVLLVWETADGPNALTLVQQLVSGGAQSKAIPTAPEDSEYLEMRAGPDFEILQKKRVVVFGAGSVGSHLAVRLAECGIGTLSLYDSDLLRPGNVVRHIGRRDQVGLPKTNVVQAAISERIPWTKVELGYETWDVDKLAAAVGGADLVIDATGNGGFTDLLSELCCREKRWLIGAALYRRGALGRIERQATAGDTPTGERDVGADSRYPLIPPGDEPASLEPGCTARVNNAPPSTVAALAAQAAEVAIDALTGKFSYGDDLIEVYRPLAVAPFDRVGTVRVE